MIGEKSAGAGTASLREDIGNSTRIRAVVLRGQAYDPAALDSTPARVEQAAALH